MIEQEGYEKIMDNLNKSDKDEYEKEMFTFHTNQDNEF